MLKEKEFLNIYSYQYSQIVRKGRGRHIRHERKNFTSYYFSVNDTTEIQALTLTNVRLALEINKDLDKKLVEAFPENDFLLEKTNNKFNINIFLNNLISK